MIISCDSKVENILSLYRKYRIYLNNLYWDCGVPPSPNPPPHIYAPDYTLNTIFYKYTNTFCILVWKIYIFQTNKQNVFKLNTSIIYNVWAFSNAWADDIAN